MDITGNMVKIVLHYIFYSNEGSLGSKVGKTLGDVEKTPQKRIMGAKNINILVGEN